MTITELRSAIGASQEEMARKLEVSVKTVQRAELTGDLSPKLWRAYWWVAEGRGWELTNPCPCCLRRYRNSADLAQKPTNPEKPSVSR